MADESSRLIEWLLRSTVFLTVAWLIVWSLLRVFHLHSVRWQTLAWFSVLFQAVLVIPAGIEIPVRVPLVGLPPVGGPGVTNSPDTTLYPRQTPDAFYDSDFKFEISNFDAVSASVAAPALDADFNVEISNSDDLVSVASIAATGISRDAVSSRPSVAMVLVGVWLTGVIVSIGWMFLSYARFLRRLPSAGEYPDSWSIAWSAVQDSSNRPRRRIRMHVTEELGPAIFWMPGGCRLLIPRDRWAPLSDAQRECVMRHEFAHWQRGDLWRMVVFRSIASLQWFNPLAWSAVRRLEECSEWACDDFAQSSREADSADYVRALLEFSIVPNCVPSPVPSASGHSLVRRARRILTPAPRKDSKMKKLTLAVITAAVIAAHAVTFKLVAEEPEKPVVAQEPVPAGDDRKPTTVTASGKQSAVVLPATLPQSADVGASALSTVEAVTPNAPEIVPQAILNGVSINVPTVGTITATDATISFTKGVTITSVLPSASAPQVKDSGAAILQELKAAEAPESDEARAERLRSQGGTREAVIDMAHVFKNDPEFERLRTEMLREVEIADAKLKLEATQLAIAGKPPEALSGEEAKALQSEMMKRRAQFELEVKMTRDRMATRESEMFLTVYQRIRKAIAAHAKENGIHIVRRASMQSEQERQLNCGDPMAVRLAMSHEVVYVADDTLDITEEVIARLKAEFASKANATPDPAVNNTVPVLN